MDVSLPSHHCTSSGKPSGVSDEVGFAHLPFGHPGRLKHVATLREEGSSVTFRSASCTRYIRQVHVTRWGCFKFNTVLFMQKAGVYTATGRR